MVMKKIVYPSEGVIYTRSGTLDLDDNLSFEAVLVVL